MNPTLPDIQMVALFDIAPESSVNVRRRGIEESVEELVRSMNNHGYLNEFPVVLRPHPAGEASDYPYEHVEGQCRILASGKVGFEVIPALIEEMDDDQAVRRSWNENEKRTNLSPSDKSYSVERQYQEFLRLYQTRPEARKKTAEFFSMSESTIANYLAITVLPDSVQKDLDTRSITQPTARAIAKSFDAKNPEASEETMESKAGWFKEVDNADRRLAVDVLDSMTGPATVEALDAELEKRKEEATSELTIRIPSTMRGPLEAYGQREGLSDISEILRNAAMRTLRNEKLL